MSLIAVRAKLLEWGNSFGLRLSRQDVERLHLRLDTEVEVKVDVEPNKIRVEDLHSFDLGGDAADRHDEYFANSAEEDLRKRRR